MALAADGFGAVGPDGFGAVGLDGPSRQATTSAMIANANTARTAIDSSWFGLSMRRYHLPAKKSFKSVPGFLLIPSDVPVVDIGPIVPDDFRKIFPSAETALPCG
jgi:hypothetical protein